MRVNFNHQNNKIFFLFSENRLTFGNFCVIIYVVSKMTAARRGIPAYAEREKPQYEITHYDKR